MSTIQIIGNTVGDPHTLIVDGAEIIELHVCEIPSGQDSEGRYWQDNDPLTWRVLVRDEELAAFIKPNRSVNVEGDIRHLPDGSLIVDRARVALNLSTPNTQEKPY